MAKKSMIIKANRPQKFKVREYTRCTRCGRPHAVMSKFGICRICFRELAYKGQIPGIKKSIAGFKLREGQAIGCKVTLRGDNMYNFLDKLISISLPQVRDFRGVSSKAFDGRGNYTMGIKEQLIFQEINYDDVVKVRGMDIIFVTTAKTNEESFDLLNGLGIPFRK